MHEDVKEAIDQIDAMLFTGDTMMDPTARRRFRDTMERWSRRLGEWDYLHADETRRRIEGKEE